MNGPGVWRVWVKTEETFGEGDGRGHLRGGKSSRRSQKGKNLATSRKDHEMKGGREDGIWGL